MATGDLLDDDGYPTAFALDFLTAYPADNWKLQRDALDFMGTLWRYPEYWSKHDGENEISYNISTGGWSGNEELIGALEGNMLLWTMCWYSSSRGGHHVFIVKKGAE